MIWFLFLVYLFYQLSQPNPTMNLGIVWILHVLHYCSRPFWPDTPQPKPDQDLPKKWMFNVFIGGPLVIFSVLLDAPKESPTIGQFLFDAVRVFLFNNMLFYWFHRLVHIYKYSWHKRHHHWISLDHPWSAFDASWIEHMLINVSPFALSCWFFRVSQWSCVVMAFLGTENAMRAHMGRSPFHAYHHANPSYHFGNIDFFGISIWDTLGGTLSEVFVR